MKPRMLLIKGGELRYHNALGTLLGPVYPPPSDEAFPEGGWGDPLLRKAEGVGGRWPPPRRQAGKTVCSPIFREDSSMDCNRN